MAIECLQKANGVIDVGASKPDTALVAAVAFVLAIVLMVPDVLAQRDNENQKFEKLLQHFDERRAERNWPYEKLSSEADTIVVATFSSRREVAVAPESTGSLPGDLQGIASTLNVLAVLKGDSRLQSKQVDVHHYRLKPNVLAVGVDAEFLTFYPKMAIPYIGSVAEGEEMIGWPYSAERRFVTPEYLLFLRRQPDGNYVPASGQRYAGKSSRIINK